MAQPPTLILASGGLRSLVATAIIASGSGPERGRLIMLHLRDGRANAPVRLEHVRRQAAHFAVFEIIELPFPHLHTKRADAMHDLPPASPLTRPQVALIAMSHAIDLGVARLVLPWHYNADHAAVSAATEEIVLLQSIAGIEHEKLPSIETPLIELSDKQMIETGGHLDAPWHLAWTCLLHGEHPCRVCAACRRRHAAFESAGLVDPVDAAVIGR